MSILFADIYDGIRAIRTSKGVCERDILNYVQEKAGGCMKVGNVLKTIRTLKKLVDCGQLIKKGNRYCFPPKDDCEKEEEEEEDEDVPEDDNGEDMDMEPDECEEGDDDDEEEEEEEDEDEEDEDDDDDEAEDDEEDEDEDEEEDESCNENDDTATAGAGDSQKAEANGETPDKPRVPPNQGDPDCAGAQKVRDDEMTHSRNGISRTTESSSKNSVKKTVKDKNILDQNNGVDKGESIAFCARDFIDSLADSKSGHSSKEKIEISKATERVMKMPKRFSTASKKTQPPRNKSNVERFRSRSPLSARKRQFNRVGQDLSNNLGFIGAENDLLGGSINSKMEIDINTEAEAFALGQRSPARDSPTREVQIELEDEKDRRNDLAESGVLNRIESSDGFMENIPKETLKLMQMKPATYSNMVWYPLEDNDNTQEILQECSSIENSNVVAKKDSMCSVCEKKKRTS